MPVLRANHLACLLLCLTFQGLIAAGSLHAQSDVPTSAEAPVAQAATNCQ